MPLMDTALSDSEIESIKEVLMSMPLIMSVTIKYAPGARAGVPCESPPGCQTEMSTKRS